MLNGGMPTIFAVDVIMLYFVNVMGHRACPFHFVKEYSLHYVLFTTKILPLNTMCVKKWAVPQPSPCGHTASQALSKFGMPYVYGMLRREMYLVQRSKDNFMATLTPESKAFLTKGTRTGKLATVRPDGRPHVVPIWFVLDGDTIVFNTGEKSVKGLNMQRDKRVCLCVDDETPPYAYVMIEGTVEMSANLDEMLRWSTIIGGRYMGQDRAEEFGKRNAVPGELLVRLTPTKVIFLKDIAD